MAEESKEFFERNPVIIGAVLALIITIVSIFGVFVYLLVGIIVGFMVGTDYKKGAINGTVMGLIVGIVLVLIPVFQGASLSTTSIIQTLVLLALPGAIGGLFGSLIKAESEIDRA
jgi:hypothetical protein